MPEAAETAVLSLWLPILVTTVATFILSMLAWTALPHHKPDVRFYPKQQQLLEALRAQDVEPGNYLFPMCQNPKDYKSDEYKAALKQGPWGTISIWPAGPNMGRNLGVTLVTLALVAVFVGYITAQACSPGADASRVFQIAMTTAVLCHVFGGTLNGVWFGKRLRFFITDAIDGLVYSAATGAAFALLWPAAETAINTG